MRNLRVQDVPPLGPDDLTTAEAAKVGHVSEDVILQWVARGYLKRRKVRLGSRVINAYSENDVLRAEKGRRDNGRQATPRWLDQ
jgi:hypothetical protein